MGITDITSYNLQSKYINDLHLGTRFWLLFLW